MTNFNLLNDHLSLLCPKNTKLFNLYSNFACFVLFCSGKRGEYFESLFSYLEQKYS